MQPRTAWLFPGQGSQNVGMGRDLCDASPAARRVFAEADDALGFALSKLIFEGPEAELTLTANAQPALVTVSVAVLSALRERVPNLPPPALAAGHSLGEYSALVASGCLRLADAVRVVRARGEAMQSAVAPGEGAMAAIMGVEPVALAELCVAKVRDGEVLSLANFNAPGQIVIAGNAASVQAASSAVGEVGGKAIPLKVSAPFHCALMAPAAQVVAAKLAGITLAEMAFPVVANVDGAANQDRARVTNLLTEQVSGAVRWQQSVESMIQSGVTNALEIGYGKVLAGLCKRINKDLKVVSIGDVASLEAFASSLS
jgi:[acyl-carrier-protein] S-malonyltransferase